MPFRSGSFSSFSLGSVDARPGADGTIAVPDAQLLFNAEFKKLGDDLLLLGDDGKSFLVQDYFKGDKLATLMAPSGATLAGRLVGALTGGEQHVQEAQAGAAAATAPIGRIEKVTGTATIVRNGVAIAANQGDVVLKGDVLQTAAGSTLGVAFIDGTVFSLSASARLAVNELVYDPNGTSNAAFMSIIQGSVTFVAGQVAKTGDMKVGTPVATMGIRGTAVFVNIDANSGDVKVSLLVERGGELGRLRLDDNAGNFLSDVADANFAIVIRGSGPGQVQVSQVALSPLEQQQALQLLTQAYQTLDQFNQGPQLQPREGNAPGANSNGSSTPPDLNKDNLPQQDFTPPQFNTTNNTGGQNQGSSSGGEGSGGGANAGAFDAGLVFETFLSNPGFIPLLSFVTGGTFKPGSAFIETIEAPPLLPKTFADLSSLIVLEAGGNAHFDTGQFLFLAEGEIITYTIAFFVESNGSTVKQTVTFQVKGINEAAEVTVDPVFVTGFHAPAPGDNGEVVLVTGSLSFSDVDLTDQHTVTFKQDGGLLGQFLANEVSDTFLLGTGGKINWVYTLPQLDFDALFQGEVLTESFTVFVNDFHTGGLVPTTVEVILVGVNDAPVGHDDENSVEERGVQPGNDPFDGSPEATGNVLDNDTDIDHGDTKAVVHVVGDGSEADVDADGSTVIQGKYGTLTINADGSYTYVLDNDDPDTQALLEGQEVTDVFTYTVQDAHAGVNDFDELTDTATLTIKIITGTNDQPFIVTAGTVADGTVKEDVNFDLGNAANLLTQGLIKFGNVDEGDSHVLTFTFDEVTGSASGLLGFLAGDPEDWLTLDNIVDAPGANSSGSFGWTFSAPNATFQFLGANDFLTFTYTVTITDEHGATAEQVVTVTVEGTNDDPFTTSAAQSGSVQENAGVQGFGGEPGNESTAGTITFKDVDVTDTHTASFLPQADDYVGTFSLDPVGPDSGNGGNGELDWHFTVDDADIDYLAAGETLTQKYDVTVDDGHGGTVLQTLTVTIKGTNDAPTLSGTAEGTTTEDATLSASGLLSVADVDLSDGHVWSVLGPDDSPYGTFSVDQFGKWTYTLNNGAAQSLAENQTVEEFYTVQVDDGHGGLDTQVIKITINGANDPPDITGTAEGAVTEDATLSATGQLAEADVDLTDGHVWSVLGSDGSPYGTFSVDQSGKWTYTLNNGAAQSLAEDQTVEEFYTVQVDDGHGGLDTQVVKITINGANDAPERHRHGRRSGDRGRNTQRHGTIGRGRCRPHRRACVERVGSRRQPLRDLQCRPIRQVDLHPQQRRRPVAGRGPDGRGILHRPGGRRSWRPRHPGRQDHHQRRQRPA